MKITTQTIRRIIKEELRKVLAEALYDTPEEKEEAIQNLMAKFKMSREDAEEAIVGVDQEMMSRSEDYQEFQKEKDEKQKAVRTFKDFAEKGRKILGLSDEFRQSLAHYFFKNPTENRHPLVQLVADGFEYCIQSRFEGEEYQSILQKIDAGEQEMQKNPLFRDLQAYNQLKQGNLDLDDFQDQVQSKCIEDLGYALLQVTKLVKAEEERNKIQKYNTSIREKTKVLPENALANLDALEKEFTNFSTLKTRTYGNSSVANLPETHRLNRTKVLNAIGNLKIIINSDGFNVFIKDENWLPELATLLSEFHYHTLPGRKYADADTYSVSRDFIEPLNKMRQELRDTLRYYTRY